MTIIAWTGIEVAALRAALRDTQVQFADRIGCSVEAVGKWERRGSGITLGAKYSECMDTACGRLDDEQRARFDAVLRQEEQKEFDGVPTQPFEFPPASLRSSAATMRSSSGEVTVSSHDDGISALRRTRMGCVPDVPPARHFEIAAAVANTWHLFFSARLGDMEQATPEQRGRLVAQLRSPQVAAAAEMPNPVRIEVVLPNSGVDIWSADCTTIAHDLTRKDLVLDRRQISIAFAGVIVGLPLLEPLERWLSTKPDCAPMDHLAIDSGYQEIEQLENTARVFREWDDQFGGGLRRKAVVGQLSEVNEMLQDVHSPQIKRRLLRVLALLAETTATMSWDSGEQETAQEYYILAIRAANAADDPALCANAIAGMARQLMSLDHYGTAFQRADTERERAADALELIRLAQDRFADRVTPTVRAMLHTRAAWAYGKLGRLSAFRRSCDKADSAFADCDPAEDPYWINYFDAAELRGTLGGRLLEIARREPSFAGEAAESISNAISLRRSNRLRSSALDELGIAEARMIEGEFDEACRLGQTALDTVEKTASDRVRKKLLRVYKHTEQLQSVGAVAELRDRMRPMVSV